MHHHFNHFGLGQMNMSGGFFEAFFAELLASLIILIIGSYFIPKYLEWRQKPHLVIINPGTRNSTFYLTRAQDGFWEASLEFSIKNEGATTQREWYWHLMVPSELQPSLISRDPTITSQNNEIAVNGQIWKHFFGNSQPKEIIFAGRGFRFNYELKIKTTDKQPRDYKIHYYFNTEFGTWPAKAREIESMVDKPEIVFTSDYLASIDLKPQG